MNEINITSAKYIIDDITNQTTIIKFVEDGVTRFVSTLDPANRHYAEIMRQVEAGTLTIQEAE